MISSFYLASGTIRSGLPSAVTRARRHLAIIGDSATVTSDKHLARLVDHLSIASDVRTAFDFLDEVTVAPNAALSKQQAESAAKDSKTAEDRERKKNIAEQRRNNPAAVAERTETRRKQYQKLLADFLSDDATQTLELPPTLNSFMF